MSSEGQGTGPGVSGPMVRAMTRAEFEDMVLDDLNRPPVKDSSYVIEVLLVRDAGICGLCLTSVDSGPRERYDPARPQVDHIIERCRGGAHAWENLRLTHGFCNNYRDNYPGVSYVDAETFRTAFERAVHKWENPHVYLPRDIAWDEALIADYSTRTEAAQTALRSLAAAGGGEEELAAAAREAAHWARLLRNARTHHATLTARVARHLARLGLPGT